MIYIIIPLIHYIFYIIDSCNECFDQLFLTTQFWTGIDGLTDCDEDFLVLTEYFVPPTCRAINIKF